MPLFGSYPVPPAGNDDFTPGSVIASLEFDGNFGALSTYLNSQFVDDTVIPNGAISGLKITDNTIDGGDKLLDGTVTGAKIDADTITAANLAPDSVTASELADNSVDTAAVQDLAITEPKLADNAVDDRVLADDAVDTAAIQDLAVTGAKIDNLTINAGTKIIDGTITSNKLAVSIQPPSAVPAGTVLPYASAVLPAGYLFCDGAEYDPVVEVQLHSVIGFAFNTGGETPGWFRVPDLRGRTPFGLDDMGTGEGAASRLVTYSGVMGGSGGVEEHTLSNGEMPRHDHTPGTTLSTQADHSHGGATGPSGSHKHFPSNAAGFVTGGRVLQAGDVVDTGPPENGYTIGQSAASDTDTVANHTHTISLDGGHTHSINIADEGNDEAHINMPPYLAMNYIIAQ